MFAGLCPSSYKNQAKSLPSQSFTGGERKAVMKLTSTGDGVCAVVTRRHGVVRDSRVGDGVGDFSSQCQEAAVGVTTNQRRGSQKRWGPDFVI